MDACLSSISDDELMLAFMIRLFVWWALEGAVVLHPALNEREENGMIKAVDIKAELAGRPVLRGRGKDTTAAAAKEAFAVLAPFRDGGIFAGSFSGESPWERHQNGDELVHILDGATTLTIMTANGPQSFTMTAGMLIVVPQGYWHRFYAPDGVTVLTATPPPTDHTFVEDPRTVV
jgi:mannose-6-phosphate isomerase-like protein (cupin superfamily)